MSGFEIAALALSAVGTIAAVSGQMQAADAGEAAANAQAAAQAEQGYYAQQQGIAQQNAANFEAEQLLAQANNERATSQRVAAERRRETRLAQSRAQALSAASGAGALDPTVVKIQDDLGAEGEYRALSALYEGDTAGIGLENQAEARRYEGKQARYAGDIGQITANQSAGITRQVGKANASAGRTAATGTLISGASSLFTKYSDIKARA